VAQLQPFLSYFNLVTAADKINKLCGLMYWPLVSPPPTTSWDRTTVGRPVPTARHDGWLDRHRTVR
jgi:hypothetical protein